MHDVTALVAKSEKLTAATRRFETAVVCPLVQSFSLLPITEDFAKALSVYASQTKTPLNKPIEELSDELQILAIEISHDCLSRRLYIHLLFRRAGRPKCARL